MPAEHREFMEVGLNKRWTPQTLPPDESWVLSCMHPMCSATRELLQAVSIAMLGPWTRIRHE